MKSIRRDGRTRCPIPEMVDAANPLPEVTNAPERFLASALTAYEDAVGRTGRMSRSFRIARHLVRIECAGPALAEPVTAALAHLGTVDEADPDLHVRVFDSTSTGSTMPSPRWDATDYTGRGDVRGFNDARFFTSYRIGTGDLSMVDRATGDAVFWLPDAARLPGYEAGAPLRTILNAWFGARRTPLVHAGAVGATMGGVLVVGEGGRGKSTLTFSAALAGMDYAGDDYVLVEAQRRPYVHGVYRTGKLDAGHLAETFPALNGALGEAGRRTDNKKVFFVDAVGIDASAGFPLRAIVVPELHATRTALRPAPGGLVLRSMLPSTITQLAGSGRQTFADLSALSRHLPGYVIELGADAIETAPRLLLELSSGR